MPSVPSEDLSLESRALKQVVMEHLGVARNVESPLQSTPERDNHESREFLQDVLQMPVAEDRIVTSAPEEPFRLTFIDVTCLLVNRAIGTGIFNGPQEVMKGVQSPGVAILLWFCGCIYGLCGAHVFLEYGLNVPRYVIDGVEQSVPRSGGELHYLQYVYSWPRYKKGTVLLSGVMFGISFICVGNMASNCIDCAIRLVQIATEQKPDEGLVRGIAVLIATVTCFIHAFSRRGGILLNNVLAALKTLFLVFMIISTWVVAGGWSGISALRVNTSTGSPNPRISNDSPNHAQAFLFVIFAFFGFDQPSYVLGEIRHPRKTFPKSMWWGMGIVSVLYVAVNICYMIIVPAEAQVNNNVAQEFFKRIFGANMRAQQTFNACLALSSFGNVVVWTYTAARMKQEIAKQGFLPFAGFFAKNKDVSFGRLLKWFEGASWNSSHRKIGFLNPANHMEKTPVGALTLHLASCVVLILATFDASANDSYIVLSTVFSYIIAAWFGSFLAIGILILHYFGPPEPQAVRPPDQNRIPQHEVNKSNWQEITKGTVNSKLGVVCASLYLVGSLYPVVASWVPPPSSSRSPSMQWYIVPLSSLCILIFSVLWFLGFIGVAAYRNYVGRKEFIFVSEPEFDWADGSEQDHRSVEDVMDREQIYRMHRGGLILTHETIYKGWRATETHNLQSRYAGNNHQGHRSVPAPSGADFANTDFAASRQNPAFTECIDPLTPMDVAARDLTPSHDDSIRQKPS